jgi:hypothetical protein
MTARRSPSGTTSRWRRSMPSIRLSRDEVKRFRRTGVDAGYRDDGAPGPRPQCGDDYYGAFLLDPDGNSVEAVIHGGVRAPGNIDHVWTRVPDLAATTAFDESISEFIGFDPRPRRPERAHFRGRSASFARVDDDRPPPRTCTLPSAPARTRPWTRSTPSRWLQGGRSTRREAALPSRLPRGIRARPHRQQRRPRKPQPTVTTQGSEAFVTAPAHVTTRGSEVFVTAAAYLPRA